MKIKRDNKNILMLLRNPFINDSRVMKEGRSLAKSKLEITVFCLWNKGLSRSEKINGIHIERIQQIFIKKNNLLKNLSVLFLFSIKSIFLCRSYHIIHCHDLDTLPVGIFIKWLSLGRKKIIYDAHEYATGQFNCSNIKKKVLCEVFKIIERLLIPFADHVICVSDSIAKEYIRLYKIKKPSLILNCPLYFNKTSPTNYFREKFNLNSNQMIFLYQGGFTKDRGIESTLDAFKKRKETDKVIIFMGYGILENTIKLASTQYGNVFYHPAVSPDILLDYTTSANIGILLYKNTCLNHYYCLPNKFFEYTQAELPVLISDLYEMKNIVEKYKNGIWVEDDITKLEKAVDKITWDDITNYKKNIPKMKGIYNWEQQEKVLLQIYNNLS